MRFRLASDSVLNRLRRRNGDPSFRLGPFRAQTDRAPVCDVLSVRFRLEMESCEGRARPFETLPEPITRAIRPLAAPQTRASAYQAAWNQQASRLFCGNAHDLHS